MNTKFEVLRVYLSELTFAQVKYVSAKDEHLIAFRDRHNTTCWSDEPDFSKKRAEFSSRDWLKTERSYNFFYGFAAGSKGDVHFDSKGHNYANEDFAEFGIVTKQHELNPPSSRSWIVGSVIRPERPHFLKWSRCTESEALFADFLLKGKDRFSSDDLRRLCVRRHISEGEGSNRLANMAMLFLARDLSYFLDTRMRHGGGVVDHQVYELTQKYELGLWEEYKEKALAQNLDPVLKYSILIPEPSPKPIKELRATEGESPVVGLNTPFAKLNL